MKKTTSKATKSTRISRKQRVRAAAARLSGQGKSRAPRPARPGGHAPRPRLAAPPPPPPGLVVTMVDTPSSYAVVKVDEPITETSMERLFDDARLELLRQKPRRVLVDMSGTEVTLSISDLNGLVKLITTSFLGSFERLALVLRPVDLPPEKFLEPSLSHRGLPTYVSVDRNDAIDWLTAPPWPR